MVPAVGPWAATSTRDVGGSDAARSSAEDPLTEIPEHLLERSRARRAALGLGGDDPAPAKPATNVGADAPPAGSAKAPAKAAAAAALAAVKKPEVVHSPEVRAANAR